MGVAAVSGRLEGRRRGLRAGRLWAVLVVAVLVGAVGIPSGPAAADHVSGERLFLCCSSSDVPRWFPGNMTFHVHHGWGADSDIDDPTTRFDLYIDGVKQVGIEERPGVGRKIHVYTFPVGLVGRHVVRAEWWETGVLTLVTQRSILFAACKGLPATIVGTPAGEVLSGTPGADVVVALAGDDVIKTFGGSDVICAGSGADDVEGGSGGDTIYGQGGPDNISGGKGPDTIFGGSKADMIFGNGGADMLFGNSGADTISGGKRSDIIEGGKSGDRLAGNSGADILRGNSGADELRGGNGSDICRGGGGADTAFSCETATSI
jgi:hypothetical protein